MRTEPNEAAYDREMQHLDDQLAEGIISQKDHNEAVLDMQRDWRGACDEAMFEAQQEVARDWGMY